MPRDDKKITLDDILAEYKSQDDSTDGAGNGSDMEISEEISIDDGETFDDVEIVEEAFAGSDSEHTWQDAGVEETPVIPGTYDGVDKDEVDEEGADRGGVDEEGADRGGVDKGSADGGDEDRVGVDKDGADKDSADRKGSSEQDGSDVGEDEMSKPDSLMTAMESSDDVNDRLLAKVVKTLFPIKGDSLLEVIRKIIFLIAVIVFIGAGVMLASTLIQSKQTLDDEVEEKNIITTTVASYIDSDGNVVTIPPTPEEIAKHNSDVADYYRKLNSDYVGYLELEGCDIHKPVVKGSDNDYYLHTNIFGNYNKAGTIFMDYRCRLTDEYTSPNLVIYGHNQEDGTMFGKLKYYKQDVLFYQENPVVKFSTDTETWEYLIYGFFVTHIYEKQDSNGEVFHYHDYIDQIKNEETFDWYIGEIQKRNQIISPVDVQFGDELLCLSTCSNEFTDSRFVVFARKLREGESVEDYDFSTARLNPYAQGVDWDAITSGMTSDDDDDSGDDEPSELVTSEKSLNKRNVKTETAATEEETLPEETSGSAVTTVPAETEETSETVAPSESSTVEESVTDVSETDGEETEPVSESDESSSGSSGTAGVITVTTTSPDFKPGGNTASSGKTEETGSESSGTESSAADSGVSGSGTESGAADSGAVSNTEGADTQSS